MADILVPAAVYLPRLQADLLAAIPELNPATDEGGVLMQAYALVDRVLTLPDALAPRAQAVVDSYESELGLRARADAALANLEAAWAGWDTLTAVQKDAALKLNVRATAALVRLVLRRF